MAKNKSTRITKEEMFRQAVIKFRDSQKTAQDYFQLILVANGVLKPDNGLIWEQIDAILKETIGE